MKDLKGLLVEQSFKHVKTAAELYQAIPSIEPLAMDAFEPIDRRPGMWKLKAMQELEARPRFEWNQLYNLPKPEEPIETKDTSKAVTNLEVREM